MTRIGVLSDTHGHLDHRVPAAFSDADRIIHAGDICHERVLMELEALSVPLVAVAGNCDAGLPFADVLPFVSRIEIDGARILIVHDRHDAGVVTAEDTDVVIFGHSHMPVAERAATGVLWLNPGSAGQARRSPIGRSVAILDIANGDISARIVPLSDFGDQRPAPRR